MRLSGVVTCRHYTHRGTFVHAASRITRRDFPDRFGSIEHARVRDRLPSRVRDAIDDHADERHQQIHPDYVYADHRKHEMLCMTMMLHAVRLNPEHDQVAAPARVA